MSPDQRRPENGERRVNEAGEEEIALFGSWWPKEEAEPWWEHERASQARWSRRAPQKRPKVVVAASVDGGVAELSGEQQSWADSARNRIRRAGHRRGGARELLIELFAREDCALTVQEIDRRLAGWRRDGAVRRPVAIASIYRGVEVLQDLRLISRVDVGDGVARYERAPIEHHEHHHHHFVCDSCGLLVPFDDDALEQAIGALENRFGFKAKEHEVVLRGTCLSCR